MIIKFYPYDQYFGLYNQNRKQNVRKSIPVKKRSLSSSSFNKFPKKILKAPIKQPAQCNQQINNMKYLKKIKSQRTLTFDKKRSKSHSKGSGKIERKKTVQKKAQNAQNIQRLKNQQKLRQIQQRTQILLHYYITETKLLQNQNQQLQKQNNRLLSKSMRK